MAENNDIVNYMHKAFFGKDGICVLFITYTSSPKVSLCTAAPSPQEKSEK